MTTIKAESLTAAAFAPFGEVIGIDEERAGQPINGGTTQRFDLARAMATGTNAAVVIGMARATPSALPLELTMVERHPYGSQAFVPVRPTRFLVVVAPDEAGRPGPPRAFLAGPGQGVNYRQGTWHGVLTALGEQTDFVVIDRIGDEENVEVFRFLRPYRIET